jgi:hypothetical protein
LVFNVIIQVSTLEQNGCDMLEATPGVSHQPEAGRSAAVQWTAYFFATSVKKGDALPKSHQNQHSI